MNKEQEKMLGTLIRDITKVGSVPKSEARRRIEALLKDKDKAFIEWTKRLDKDGCHSVSTQKIRDWIKQKYAK